MALGLQYALVMLLVTASALYVLHNRLPRVSRSLRVWLATRLLRQQRWLWLHTVARRIAPPIAKNGACAGCSSGCRPE